MSYIDGRRSVFPDGGVDSFLELYSLPSSQRSNLGRYQFLKLQNNLTPAEQTELNNLTITLQHYIIDVEKWNKFADAVFNLETFFLDETVGYIEQKQTEFQSEVDKLAVRGEWQPGVQYYKKNIVTSSGEGFIAKTDNINQSPSSTTHWSKIAAKGEKGDPSLNISYKGAYEISRAYVVGDAVTFGGLWYYAKQNTLGNSPINDDYWALQSNQAVVSSTQPFDNRITGWIDTSL